MRLTLPLPIALAASLACSPSEQAPRGSVSTSDPLGAPRASIEHRPSPTAGAGSSATPASEGEPQGSRRDLSAVLAGATRAAVGDLDGDGRHEIVWASAKELVVARSDGTRIASTEARGAPQALELVDLGDGSPRIVVGWGADKSNQSARSSVTVHRLAGSTLHSENVLAPESSRHEITGIVSTGGALMIGHFVDTFHVRLVRATRGPDAWLAEELAQVRMATSLAYGDTDGDGRSALFVGRVYGDDRGVDGDAFELRDGGVRLRIPTVRGVRGLALADTDADGLPELFLGDGWHQDYGKVARARLSRARWVEGDYRTELLAELGGQFTIWQVLPLDVDGDGRPEILSRGNSSVWIHRERAGRWHGLRVAGHAEHLAGGKLDEGRGERLLVLGARPELVDLSELSWPE